MEKGNLSGCRLNQTVIVWTKKQAKGKVNLIHPNKLK